MWVDAAHTVCILAFTLPADVQWEMLGCLLGCAGASWHWGRDCRGGEVADGEGKETLAACLKYALFGMPRRAFVGLLELVVPQWDRANA